MPTTKGRITISRNPKESFELAAKIFAKHKADGAASPLKELEGYSWETEGPKISIGLELHEQAEKLKGQMDLLYRQRDAIYEGTYASTKASSTYLRKNMPRPPKN